MMTVMGDALVDGLSDAGSTPARSTIKTANHLKDQVVGGFLYAIYDFKNVSNASVFCSIFLSEVIIKVKKTGIWALLLWYNWKNNKMSAGEENEEDGTIYMFDFIFNITSTTSD